ncbi:micrococcal nuclease [Desulfobotulus alkaliphilus]|uniref:Micrococcal nuclease n=1 Tax=Desulfobotulus alkaliphilus TaxID=622671 RepID=A0A562S0B7_9BACT|nr:thermonuclease family protein [Desulfobotulus alkaliphilus]TWI74334.1 micrococcal nuclease [Desulfobotulus alkaliphilus]
MLLVFLFLPVMAAHAMERVEIGFIPDGDTVRLRDGRWIRLMGIDAPEMSHGNQKGSCGGDMARKALLNLIGKKPVYLKTTGKDRHGRILGKIYLENGLCINTELIRLGMAWVYIHGKPDEDQKKWMDLQKTAIFQKKGIWQFMKKSPPVVGNRRSYRFHLSDCAFGKKISPRNRIFFASAEEAFAAGYAPARNCLPDPICP